MSNGEEKKELKRTREGKRSTKNKEQKNILKLVKPCMRPEVPSPTLRKISEHP